MSTFEASGRAVKALRIIDKMDALVSQQLGHEATPVETYQAAQVVDRTFWDELAKQNGINKPSDETVATVLKALEYRARDLVDEPFPS